MTYAATPYLTRMAAEGRWQGHLVHDEHGQPSAILAVRVGRVWTDAVAIESEDRTVAVRTRTNDDGLILPGELSDRCGAVWRRDGRTADVLAELLDLPDPNGATR